MELSTGREMPPIRCTCVSLSDTEKQVSRNLLWREQQIHLAPRGGSSSSRHPSDGLQIQVPGCLAGQQRCVCVCVLCVCVCAVGLIQGLIQADALQAWFSALLGSLLSLNEFLFSLN
ncbi:hypothetical protein VULLAG_LOCUS4556 [Vulpes lagopus]